MAKQRTKDVRSRLEDGWTRTTEVDLLTTIDGSKRLTKKESHTNWPVQYHANRFPNSSNQQMGDYMVVRMEQVLAGNGQMTSR